MVSWLVGGRDAGSRTLLLAYCCHRAASIIEIDVFAGVDGAWNHCIKELLIFSSVENTLDIRLSLFNSFVVLGLHSLHLLKLLLLLHFLFLFFNLLLLRLLLKLSFHPFSLPLYLFFFGEALDLHQLLDLRRNFLMLFSLFLGNLPRESIQTKLR